MNEKPHTHALKVELQGNSIRIQYGDQTRHHVYTMWPGWNSRMRRVTARMIRKHDRDSLKAGKRQEKVQQLQQLPVNERQGVWGRDVLKGTPLLPVTAKITKHSISDWYVEADCQQPCWFPSERAALKWCEERQFVIQEAQK